LSEYEDLERRKLIHYNSQVMWQVICT